MEPRDARTAIDAAERAAAAADFTSAERLLREAAELQEEHLGPSHPDLANTLNNLGIVCENTGKLDDAEAFYRRASEMAAATLPADHPFVATSRRNLMDFTSARRAPRSEISPEELEKAFDLGIDAFPDAAAPQAQPVSSAMPGPDEKRPVDAPRAAPPAPASRATPKADRVTRQTAAAPAKANPVPSAKVRLPATPPRTPQSSRRTAMAVIGVVVLLAAILMMRLWSRADSSPDTPTPTPTPPATEPEARTEPPASATPQAAVPVPEPPPSAPPSPQVAEPAPTEAPPAPDTPSGSSSTPTLAIAEVCRTLSTGSGVWKCDPIGDEVPPGRLAFYTRVRSPRNTTVVHRWYQDDRLVQTVTLTIGANAVAGYRTYSRQSVDDDGSRWRVEARSADGALLHEERFVVR